MQTPLDSKQTAELASLLDTVSAQRHLSSNYRGQASYWAGQICPGLDPSDMVVVGWLLEDVAASPLLPDPMQQRARVWATTIRELTGGQEAD